jgi:GDSL-like Lipase/Acylhydrolase family
MKNTICLTLVLAAAPAIAAAQGFTYLALGDSVPFGMNITLVPPYSSTLPTPSEFVGYPETIANIDQLIGLKTLLNAACPGETSGSFLNTAVLDNGCNSPHVVAPPPGSNLPPIILPPFKTSVGLHVNYNPPTESQMAFAMSQLQTNKQIKLVTLSIGANDVLLALPALEACNGNATCEAAILTPLLDSYATNLGAILGGIRSQYSGLFILLTYYSYLPELDALTQQLNSVTTQVAANFPNITIADGYKAFSILDAPFGDSACNAGLLIKLPPNPYNTTPCDLHPSPLGRTVLAATVELAAFGVN